MPDFSADAVTPLILRTARVLRVDAGGYALVEVMEGGCGRCDAAGGCGGAHPTRMFCFRPRRYRVRNGVCAPVG
ncbi:MAG: SoxR reducing system RseC family protein, partial [Zoogloeaceae bacterium]|nr:SoxR reducing system RseC family protein [Zoogloeaceae bacterium]